MSRRRRRAIDRAVRSRVVWAKAQRRRGRDSGARRAATAATAAAVTLAAAGASVAAPGTAVSTMGLGTTNVRAGVLPSSCGNPRTPPSLPTDLVDVGGALVLHRRRRHPRPELWKSDGTEAGTVLVKDIDPDDGYYSGPTALTAVGDTLFFSADDGIHGRELWKSDGTKAGTVLVKDIDPDDGYYAGQSDLTAVGGTLFFSADDGGPRSGAVEVRRDQGGHRPGQGHRPQTTTASTAARVPDRRGRHVVLHRRRRHPRPGAVEVRRHGGRHGPGQGHPPG